jgi:hypothetical protein
MLLADREGVVQHAIMDGDAIAFSGPLRDLADILWENEGNS